MKLAGIAAATAIVMAALLAVGFYAGMTWANGRHDAADLKTSQTQLAATQQALSQSLTDWQRAVAQFRDDRAALAAIAQEYADGRIRNAQYFDTLDNRLDAALAARPDLAACDIGPDGLQIWNDANRGVGVLATGAAAATDRRSAAAAVSSAAAGQKQPAAGPAAQPPASDGGLPRLRQPAPANHPGDPKARSDRSRPRGVSGSPADARRVALIQPATGEAQ